jgi:hypothetical protein
MLVRKNATLDHATMEVAQILLKYPVKSTAQDFYDNQYKISTIKLDTICSLYIIATASEDILLQHCSIITPVEANPFASLELRYSSFVHFVAEKIPWK